MYGIAIFFILMSSFIIYKVFKLKHWTGLLIGLIINYTLVEKLKTYSELNNTAKALIILIIIVYMTYLYGFYLSTKAAIKNIVALNDKSINFNNLMRILMKRFLIDCLQIATVMVVIGLSIKYLINLF